MNIRLTGLTDVIVQMSPGNSIESLNSKRSLHKNYQLDTLLYGVITAILNVSIADFKNPIMGSVVITNVNKYTRENL